MVGIMKSPRWRTIILWFLILLNLCALDIVSAESRYEANASIQQAEESIYSAFEAVLEAEDAGANVSRLIVRLNEAASLLAEAEALFRNGKFGEVTELTDRSFDIAAEVKGEASILRVSALQSREFAFRVSLIGSSVGVLGFLFFMFLLWRWFKGFYIRRILRLRPEVASDA